MIDHAEAVRAFESVAVARLTRESSGSDFATVIDAAANALINIALTGGCGCEQCIAAGLYRAVTSVTAYSQEAQLKYLPPAGSA